MPLFLTVKMLAAITLALPLMRVCWLPGRQLCSASLLAPPPPCLPHTFRLHPPQPCSSQGRYLAQGVNRSLVIRNKLYRLNKKYKLNYTIAFITCMSIFLSQFGYTAYQYQCSVF
jgi:hypothetical protein